MSNFAQGILVDDSGRRRQVLRRVGRAISVLLLIWLAVLGLAWLGIEPLGNLGFVDAGVGRVTPPALPARIQSAVAGGRVITPGRPAGIAETGVRTRPAGARSGDESGARRKNAHHPPNQAVGAKPVYKHLSTSGSIPSRTETTPSTARGQEPVSSGQSPPQRAASVNPGKSQSAPGQAKREATPPSSTGSPGKSTTSPGRTKEPGQTSAQPAPTSNRGTSGNGVGTPRYKTTTTPSP
jgi:hypothetical protein